MLIDKSAQYYLKRTRAAAKEIELSVPDSLKAHREIDIDDLFPLTIACIADISANILREEISIREIKNYTSQLYFASKFYDSYLYINNSNQDQDYFLLMWAIAYYLCDHVGSSIVLARKINIAALRLCENQFDILLCAMLQNKRTIKITLTDDNQFAKYIEDFVKEYNMLMSKGIPINKVFVRDFKKIVYENGSDRDIFFIDSLLSIFTLKNEYSIFNMLPKYSPIPANALVNIVSSNHFVQEMWPAQRYMCELGFFNGQSGVVQMPTGAGKTKSISIAIYSAFYSERTKLSIVIAPFRALCREISNDLRYDLSFDENIRISEISDLLQVDYILDDLFNSERKTVVVATPEKFLYLLKQDDSIIEKIGQIFFDEGHLFDDEARGATYELLISSILTKINPETQKILISAIIPNVEEINSWFTNNNGMAFSGKDVISVDKLPSILKWEIIEGINYCYLYYIDRNNYNEFDFYVPRIIEVKELNRKKGERAKYFPFIDFQKKSEKEKTIWQ